MPVATEKQIIEVEEAAYNVWHNYYRDIFSKEQILEKVLGYDSDSSDSTIITHVKNIRTKLSGYDYMPIKTVWGIGYKWEE